MMYVYFMELRGKKLALLKTDRVISSSPELYRKVVEDPANFQRVYDQATPDDVSDVIMRTDVFEFLLCGDFNFFRKWLRSEIMKEQYRCVAIPEQSLSRK